MGEPQLRTTLAGPLAKNWLAKCFYRFSSHSAQRPREGQKGARARFKLATELGNSDHKVLVLQACELQAHGSLHRCSGKSLKPGNTWQNSSLQVGPARSRHEALMEKQGVGAARHGAELAQERGSMDCRWQNWTGEAANACWNPDDATASPR